MLVVKELNSYYGLSHILQGVTLSVAESQIACLLGRNGAGKTTTLKTIMGLVKPKMGEIWFRGQVINGLSPFEISRLGISYVPEDRRIFPRLTVLENLELGLSNYGKVSRALRNDRLDRAFNYFPFLRERAKQLGGTLSGGQQQMLAIARGLMGKTHLMLLDEPSEGLGPVIVKTIREIVRKIADDGISILLVEQNARMAFNVSNWAYIMERGKILYEGRAEELKDSVEVRRKLLL